MRLTPVQLCDLYFILMRAMFPKNPGVETMILSVDRPGEMRRIDAVSGLKDAINDMFSVGSPFLGPQRDLIDAELKRCGLPPLYIIEAARTKKFRGIIKRKKIRNEEEFYIVKGLLDDQEPLLEESELSALADIMGEYLSSLQQPPI